MRFPGLPLLVAFAMLTACGHFRRHPEDAAKKAIARGQTVFNANCAMCHGMDGNLRAPDLRISTLVSRDVNGNFLTPMLRTGRPAQGMPAFPGLSSTEITELSAFLHEESKPFRAADAAPERLPGNAAAGKTKFEQACSGCHSVTGDLDGIGTKYSSYFLQRRILYPEIANASYAKVTLQDGSQIQGRVAADDEFHISLISQDGWYHTVPRDKVRVEIRDRLAGHRALLENYTNPDIQNLVAYLVTVR